MNALVVPTNRPERLYDFLDAWSPWPWDKVLIIEDSPEITFDPSAADGEGRRYDAERIHTYSWNEIEASLPEAWIISRRDSAIRSYGFWKAWEIGADYIFTLDDDCFPFVEDSLPLVEGFVCRHVDNLETTPAWQSRYRA